MMLAEIRIKTNNFKQVEKLLLNSEKLILKNDIKNGFSYNFSLFSKYYYEINNKNKSIEYAKKALNISKNIYKNPNDELMCLKQLIAVDRANAAKHAKEYIKLSDSLQLAERRFRDKFAQIEYETEELTKEKEAAIQQKWVFTVVTIVIVLIVFLVLLITYQKAKQRDLQLRQSQRKANERIYQLILSLLLLVFETT